MADSFNFPPNPTLNQIVVLPDGNQAQWNGVAWVSVANNVTYPLEIPKGGTGATNPLTAKRNLGVPIFTVDDAAPAAPVFGDRWMRPASMTEVVWMPNSNPAGGGVWVNFADVGSVAYPIPISKGGTGATTAAAALTALGAVAKAGDTMTGVLKLADGAVAAPSLAFGAEAGLGLYRPSANQISVASGGANKFTFNGTPGGNTYMAMSRSVGFNATIVGQTSGSNRWSMTFCDGAAESGGDNGSNFYLERFSDGGTSLGNVLTIARSNGFVWFTGTAGVRIEDTANSAARLYFKAGSAEKHLRLNASGNKMEWVNAANSAVIHELLDNGQATFFGSRLHVGTSGDFGLVNDISNRYLLWNANCNFVFDNASGNITYQIGGSVKFRTEANGNWVIGNEGYKAVGGPWLGLSDERVKHDIRDYPDGLEAILALRPCLFKFKEETGQAQTDHVGLVAQEAEAVMGRLVSAAPGKMGELEFDDLRNLDPGPVTWALVNAVKTLHARLAALEPA